MRLWTFVLLMAAALGADQSTPKPAKRTPSSSPAKMTTVKLPVNAVRIAEGVYRFTDPDGTVWLFRRTPFGYAKAEEGAAKPAPSDVRVGDRSGTPFSGADGEAAGKSGNESVAPVHITATEEGDNIRFERPTPFGKTQWVKPKSELNAEETRIWESQRNQASESETK